MLGSGWTVLCGPAPAAGRKRSVLPVSTRTLKFWPLPRVRMAAYCAVLKDGLGRPRSKGVLYVFPIILVHLLGGLAFEETAI